MKKVLFLLGIVIPMAAHCYDRHTGYHATRWRETERMKPDSSRVTFLDTMYIWFRTKDSFQYHRPNGFVYNGTYSISEDSIINFGYSSYKMVEKQPKLMVLADNAGIYRFEIDSVDTIRTIVLDTGDKALPVADIDDMVGHWTVYKRTTKEKASGTIDNNKAIRSLYITGPSTDGKLGYVFSGTDAKNDPSWYIKSYGADQTIMCEGKTPRAIKVVRCQKGEMILEDDDVTYYLKQFK